MAVSERTRNKALDTLSGMSQIVKNEMITPNQYVGPVVDQDLAEAGAICGGRKACAVGSLWIAGGVKVEYSGHGAPGLPGVEEYQRENFLRPRPGLRLAYDSLNEAAFEYAERNNRVRTITVSHWNAPVEALFESSKSLPKSELLKIINSAKRKVRAA